MTRTPFVQRHNIVFIMTVMLAGCSGNFNAEEYCHRFCAEQNSNHEKSKRDFHKDDCNSFSGLDTLSHNKGSCNSYYSDSELFFQRDQVFCECPAGAGHK